MESEVSLKAQCIGVPPCPGKGEKEKETAVSTPILASKMSMPQYGVLWSLVRTFFLSGTLKARSERRNARLTDLLEENAPADIRTPNISSE